MMSDLLILTSDCALVEVWKKSGVLVGATLYLPEEYTDKDLFK
jgi:hypothetical protein